MIMTNKQYTVEETAKFKALRNKKTKDERSSKRRNELVWDSTQSGTYKGSTRKDFTGKSRTSIK